MTVKNIGSTGVEFPDSTVQGSTTYTKAESDGPAFRAVCGSLSWNGMPIKLPLATEDFDTNNCLNLTLGRFTPNVAGYYNFSSRTQLDAGAPLALLYKNGARVAYGVSSTAACIGNDLVYMNGTTDYVELWAQGPASSNLTVGTDISYFQGFLVRKA